MPHVQRVTRTTLFDAISVWGPQAFFAIGDTSVRDVARAEDLSPRNAARVATLKLRALFERDVVADRLAHVDLPGATDLRGRHVRHFLPVSDPTGEPTEG